MAMESREHVLSNEKFIEIFGEYTEALGIKTAAKPEEWTALLEKKEKVTIRMAEEAEKKRIADAEAAEKKRIAEELRLEQERIKKEQEEAKRKANLVKDFFKLIQKKGLTQYIGKKKHLQNMKVAKVAAWLT